MRARQERRVRKRLRRRRWPGTRLEGSAAHVRPRESVSCETGQATGGRRWYWRRASGSGRILGLGWQARGASRAHLRVRRCRGLHSFLGGVRVRRKLPWRVAGQQLTALLLLYRCHGRFRGRLGTSNRARGLFRCRNGGPNGGGVGDAQDGDAAHPNRNVGFVARALR